MKLVEMQITKSTMKNILYGINSRLNIAEESEFKVIAIETFQNETMKGKKRQKETELPLGGVVEISEV